MRNSLIAIIIILLLAIILMSLSWPEKVEYPYELNKLEAGQLKRIIAKNVIMSIYYYDSLLYNAGMAVGDSAFTVMQMEILHYRDSLMVAAGFEQVEIIKVDPLTITDLQNQLEETLQGENRQGECR